MPKGTMIRLESTAVLRRRPSTLINDMIREKERSNKEVWL